MSEPKHKSNINPWLLFSFGMLLVAGLFVLFLWKRIPPEIPWFYSLPWGENQLMPKTGLPLILGSNILVVFFGNLLSQWTKSKDKIIEQTIMVSLAFICFMLLINMVKVLFIFI